MRRPPVVALLVLSACLALSSCATRTARRTASPAPSSGAAALFVAHGHGWTDAGIEGPVPAPGSCHMRAAANGDPLPDPACTPGAVDSTITDGNVNSTLCRKGGYLAVVLPPDALVEPVKRKLLAAYGIPDAQSGDFELDHLVSLNAGGASDTRDLWPEPNTFRQFKPGNGRQNDKDVIETYLFHAVCDGTVPLSAVRAAMDADWTTAVRTLGLPAIPPDYQG